MPTVVIIGASHAAAEAVLVLRKQGWRGRIVLVGDEDQLPYQRPPLSKKYFSAELAAERLLIRPTEAYAKADVELFLGQRATGIDRSQHQVVLESGQVLDYDKLILATGTRPRLLPVEGAELPAIHYLRTLADVDRIRAVLPQQAKLLIVGGGYIGLEVAASAIQMGMQVTMLEALDRVLARVTGEEVSSFFQNLHRGHGVDIRLHSALQKFVPTANGAAAVLADGSQLDFDCAIVGIGVLPNTELAADAGLRCDNGIVVDEYARTEDANIYAVGDCSNHPNAIYQRRLRLESVPNAVEQGRTAARAICGDPQAYNEVPWFWSDQYDVKLQTAGLCQGYDRVVVRGEPANRDFAVFYLQQKQLIAADCINSPAEFMAAKKLIANKARPDPGVLADPAYKLKELL